MRVAWLTATRTKAFASRATTPTLMSPIETREGKMARSVSPITVSYVTTATPARIPAPAVARGGYALLLVSHADEDEGP
jgi:hypothetical protein